MQEVLQSKPFLAVHCRSTLAQILRRDKKDGKKTMARWPLKDHERYWFKDEVFFPSGDEQIIRTGEATQYEITIYIEIEHMCIYICICV